MSPPEWTPLCVDTLDGPEGFPVDSRLTTSDSAPDVQGPETGLAPVHDEHAEALLHPRLDVARVCRVAARHVEFLARGQHLLDRVFQPPASSTRSPAALVVENTPRSVPAPGHSTPMPFTAAISRTCASPSLLSTIVQLISSPSGLSGQRSAFALYSSRSCPSTRAPIPTSSGRVPPFDSEAHRGEPGAHFVGALDFDEHDAARAEVQLPADVVDRFRRRSAAIFGVLTMSGCGRRRNGVFVSDRRPSVAFTNSGQTPEARDRRLSSMLPLKRKSAALVGERFARELDRRLGRRRGGGPPRRPGGRGLGV